MGLLPFLRLNPAASGAAGREWGAAGSSREECSGAGNAPRMATHLLGLPPGAGQSQSRRPAARAALAPRQGERRPSGLPRSGSAPAQLAAQRGGR